MVGREFNKGNRHVLDSYDDQDLRGIQYIHTGRIGRLSGASATSPPSAEFLQRAGVIAPLNDPNRYFDPASRKVAQRLRAMGIGTLSIRDSVLAGIKTPDGVTISGFMTWEVKAPQTPKGIARAFEHARRQSPCLILWTQALEMSSKDAVEVLQRQLPTWGADYQEVIVMLGDRGEEYVHWIHE